jgi:galactonate dehydratase
MGASHMATPPLVITGVEYWPIQQPVDKRTYVVIRISTDASIDGWGEIAVRSDAAPIVQRLEAARTVLIGQDALRVEHVRDLLVGRSNESHAEANAVQSAVNMAQIDLLGKISRSRACETMGGPTRGKARALAALPAGDESQLLGWLAQARQAGFRAVKVPITLPAGPVRGRDFFRGTRRLFDQMRAASGGEMDFVLDCAGSTTPAEAAALASLMQDFHLLWLDEPVGRVQQQAFRGLVDESVTAIGWGRDVTANSEFQDLLRQDAVDVLRPDISAFGVTRTRKAAALAETYYVAMAPSHRGGPIGTAAALHVAASIPNFFIQEVPFAVQEPDRAMRRELAGELESPQDGFLTLPTGPGLGVMVNDDVLNRYRIRL